MGNRDNYDRALAALEEMLIKMAQSATHAVENAVQALETCDHTLAQTVIRGDEELNRMQYSIEHQSMTLLLRQQPVATDLRRVSTALKMVTDIERVGDHAADICELVYSMEGKPSAQAAATVQDLCTMARAASEMVRRATDAYANHDVEAAEAVIASDDTVDADFCRIRDELAQTIAADPQEVDRALEYLMVIKYLERIGDHAVNMAEWTRFCATGLHNDQRIV